MRQVRMGPIRWIFLFIGAVVGHHLAGDVISREMVKQWVGPRDHLLRMVLYGRYAAGAVVGLLLALIVIGIESYSYRFRVKTFLIGVFGLVLGLTIPTLLFGAMPIEAATGSFIVFLRAFLTLFMGYLGMTFAIKQAELMGLIDARWIQRRGNRSGYVVLDTSTIIDGRIADVSETGFVGGTLLIPQFVLKELQGIADSSDSLKRNRGRRGLDVVKRIQESGIGARIVEEDYPEIESVDRKLIALAEDYGARVITNDFNLNKVADIQGVQALNINELANALKTTVLPGEQLSVHIIKPGTEPNQGVGYLDDGTMVVVENGLAYVNEDVETVVTSVIQKSAGRMIFARIESSNTRGNHGRPVSARSKN